MSERGRNHIPWLQWTLASIIGPGAGCVVICVYPLTASEVGMNPGTREAAVAIATLTAVVAVIEAVIGGIQGTLQWLVLRQRVSQAGWWVLAGAVGYATGWVLSPSKVLLRDPIWAMWLMDAAVTGAAIGAAQWLVLRRQVPRAGWWIPVNAAGWIVGVIVSALVLLSGSQSLSMSILAFAVGGALVGGITGIALAWLLRLRLQLR
jgi:hypothetical protein